MNANPRVQPDSDLREQVLGRIRTELSAAAGAIDVTTEGGVVTLIGSVDNYSDKLAAENAAKRVDQVLIVADEIAVKPPHERTDTQIARDVLLRLRTHPGLPQDIIKATVTDGDVTLEGVVHWHLQKLTAESIIRSLKGVRHIRNLLEVIPPST